MHLAISLLVLLVLAGSLGYCVLVLLATRDFLHQEIPPAPAALPPISILKPLHGLEQGLADNLRTFFTQDYPVYEILFAAREASDLALAVAADLRREYPNVPARIIVTGEPPYANAKVWSLDHMTRAADHDLLVMSDSDIRVGAALLRTVAAEFSDPQVGIATCPYRAVGGPSLWSRLEAAGMNTEFWGGVFAARLIEGMRFTVGPTVAARREAIAAAGGWDRLRDYLAEDFALGALAAEKGIGVILSRYVVEHHIGSQDLRHNFGHRLRWARSTRRSRPAGYIGQIFTNPLALGLILLAVQESWWPVFAVAAVLRAVVAWSVSQGALRSAVPWLLIPAQDLLSFLFWIGGFFGNRIEWRGRIYRLLRDGRFEQVDR